MNALQSAAMAAVLLDTPRDQWGFQYRENRNLEKSRRKQRGKYRQKRSNRRKNPFRGIVGPRISADWRWVQ